MHLFVFDNPFFIRSYPEQMLSAADISPRKKKIYNCKNLDKSQKEKFRGKIVTNKKNVTCSVGMS
jgi:hypothetical protein